MLAPCVDKAPNCKSSLDSCAKSAEFRDVCQKSCGVCTTGNNKCPITRYLNSEFQSHLKDLKLSF